MTDRKLQVRRSSGWKYVFCRNLPSGKVVTTEDKKKAVGGKGALEYFSKSCANEEFRYEPATKRKSTK